ncbi:hypothetical protein CLU92_5475 [Janthinobacterium sp. 61]|uniref:hypothetical protein n=1 Tax=Janthinobacterium sp. 61 TaxID=2035209 RepID=UPI000C70190A|nr:hypothetical protein [Janthinobacterium sp. 61]PKV42736.1 hypothetical protein CLU92_0006 [Janthinobacterium sp. 61]PKV48000.1 hypothetical protein CLU92_5475 [Janthinobacterium sp. 61]
MLTLYLFDATGISIGSADVDPMGPVPRNSTLAAPPAIIGTQVARWTGANWEVLAEPPPAPIAPVIVPHKVTRRQGRLALLLAGKLDQVPVVIAAIKDETERRLAQIEWDDAQDYERWHPLVVLIGPALNLDLDALFIHADTL